MPAERTRAAIIAKSKQDETHAERQNRVFELRKSGATFRAIANELHINVERAHTAYKEALIAIPAFNVEEYRVLELERLEWALFEAQSVEMEARASGQRDQAMRALDRFLIAERSIRELTGVNAPFQEQITVVTEEVIDDAIAERRSKLALLEGGMAGA